MIPLQEKAVATGTLPGKKVAFRIGNASWVMKSLSKLYSNAILATIREYSTNARDANDEAGNKHLPIQVTLPTVYDPFFTVEDRGTGMSSEILEEVYTAFGESTKRNSNDYNGMLGFGSKSALAYTDSFTIVSRYNGVEVTAAVTRESDFSDVSMYIVSERPTDEPNGTKISVPARDYDAFKQIAMDFYRFWEPGTVEVDGVEPEWFVGEQLDDNLYYSKKQGTSYVVMGKVAYRIVNPQALFQNRGMNSISFVAYVPNGSVEFTPSREDLEYTDATKKTLYGVIENFEKKVISQAKADIDSAKDYFDAYVKYTYWSNKLGKGPFGDLEFKGEKFTDTLTINGYRYATRESRYNMYSIEKWSISQMDNTMIVTGMGKASPSSHHKSRAKKYRDMIGISASYILFTSDKTVESVWVDPKRVVDWEVVKDATKPPKQPKDTTPKPKRIKGTFDYYSDGNWYWEKELPETKELYYITVQSSKNIAVGTVLSLLESKAVVVTLAANRINKFKRDNPHVKEFYESFKPLVNLNGEKLIDKRTREALAVGSSTREWLKRLPLDQINDPEFRRIQSLLSMDTNQSLKAYNDAWNLAVAMNMRYSFVQHNIRQSDDSLLDKYPLMKQLHPRYGLSAELRAEYVYYINAKFSVAKKGNK